METSPRFQRGTTASPEPVMVDRPEDSARLFFALLRTLVRFCQEQPPGRVCGNLSPADVAGGPAVVGHRGLLVHGGRRGSERWNLSLRALENSEVPGHFPDDAALNQPARLPAVLALRERRKFLPAVPDAEVVIGLTFGVAWRARLEHLPDDRQRHFPE